MKLIINADDFGRSYQVNEAIRACLKKGIVTDTSMIATVDEGFQDALINPLPSDSIGVHLTLTLGEPLTLGIKQSRRFCQLDGTFKENVDFSTLSSEEKELIYFEFCRQVEKVASYGLKISHLDSHQHIHFRREILPIVIRCCKYYNIPFLRVPGVIKDAGIKSKINRWLICNYIKLSGLKIVDLFGGYIQIREGNFMQKSVVELMCHPLYEANNFVVDKKKGIPPEKCNLLVDNLSFIPDKCLKINFQSLL